MWFRNVVARAVFRLEQLLVRGFGFRLLAVAVFIALISIVAGALVRTTGTDFVHFRDAVWWAFLRLTDPGYLGQDVGPWRRFISMSLTILGFVVFVGALVAILTQWLDMTLRRLGLGLTPVRMHRHVVILGWTSRTPQLVDLLSRRTVRVEQWLQRIEAPRMKVVILVPRVEPQLVQTLRDQLGDRYRQDDVILRSGSPLKLDHLERVDAFHAAAIIMPGELYDTQRGSEHDARVLAVLLSMSAHRGSSAPKLPRFVAEVFDPDRIDAARTAYAGDVDLVASDLIVGRLLAAAARDPGASQILAQLQEAVEPALTMTAPQMGEQSPRDVLRRFPGAVVLGKVSGAQQTHRALRLARSDEPLGAEDLLVLSTPKTLPGTIRGKHADATIGRALVLGWSAVAPDVVADLATHTRRHAEHITVLSTVPTTQRVDDLAVHGLADLGVPIVHLEGSAASPRTLAATKPEEFDVMILLASETWSSRVEEADAMTIAAHVTLRQLLAKSERPWHCVVELTDPDNLALVRSPNTEVVIGGPFLSFVLAQTVLQLGFLALVHGILLDPDKELHFAAAPTDLDADAFRRLGSTLAPDSLVLGFCRDGITYLAPRDPALFPVRTSDDLLVFG